MAPAAPGHVVVSPGGFELHALLRSPGSHGPASGGRRRIIGITGSPGSGKSTLAAALGAALDLPVVPMDGFHLADAELARRGLLDRKGAPETFDAWGYAALLGRIAARPAHVVMAPAFERDLEQPLAGAVPVGPEADLVLTEGNYLLLDDEAWGSVRGQLHEVWHLRVPEADRTARLIERHVRHGRTRADAEAWVAGVDGPNASLVEASSGRADLILDLSRWGGRLSAPAGA